MNYVKEIEEIIALIIPLLMDIVRILVVVFVAKVALPWLKEQAVYSFVKKAVKAAEKLAEAGRMDKAEKRNYVIQLLEMRGVQLNKVVLAMIESAVEELDIAKDQLFDMIVEELPESGECDGEGQEAE